MSHTCLAGGCGPAMLAAAGAALAPLPTENSLPTKSPPPGCCLLRPVDVSKWQMMVGVCAAAWEEECQGRSFPAVSFNLLYAHLLKRTPPPTPPQSTPTNTYNKQTHIHKSPASWFAHLPRGREGLATKHFYIVTFKICQFCTKLF